MNSPNDAPTSNEADIELTLAEIERSLEQFKSRYAQVKRDLDEQVELKGQLRQTQADYRREKTPALKQEVRQIQQRLEELEITLESQLVSWGWVRETFWQVVRFGGLGIVIGWLLRSWAG